LLAVTLHAQTPSPRPRLPLVVLPETVAVCRLPAGSPLPPWTSKASAFLTVSRTPEELSITADQQAVPSEAKCERDYRPIRVRGTLPTNLVGILVAIADPLAAAGISIFAISTYDTDYVLVKAADLERAIAALEGAGHEVTR
ncbi:MAG: ACT domain-containing protein, partial [Gemmatimonadales bacterium]